MAISPLISLIRINMLFPSDCVLIYLALHTVLQRQPSLLLDERASQDITTGSTNKKKKIIKKKKSTPNQETFQSLHLSFFRALGAVQIPLNILPSPFAFLQLTRQFSSI